MLPHLSESLLSDIVGIPPLMADSHVFFPGDALVRWCVDPADWILEEMVPGSLTLFPRGENYALHFVPQHSISKDCERKNRADLDYLCVITKKC